jgi:laccase
MKTRSLSLAVAATAVAAAVIFALSATVPLGAAAAVVEHTFVVSMI